jgi:hypothetical protein
MLNLEYFFKKNRQLFKKTHDSFKQKLTTNITARCSQCCFRSLFQHFSTSNLSLPNKTSQFRNLQTKIDTTNLFSFQIRNICCWKFASSHTTHTFTPIRSSCNHNNRITLRESLLLLLSKSKISLWSHTLVTVHIQNYFR